MSNKHLLQLFPLRLSPSSILHTKHPTLPFKWEGDFFFP